MRVSDPMATTCGDGPHGSTMRRRFDFIYRIRIFGSSEAIWLWLPYPRDDRCQTVSRAVIEAPVEYSLHEEARDGNRMVHMRLPPDMDSRDITMNFRIERRACKSLAPTDDHYAEDIGRSRVARFLRPNRRVPTDGEFAATAREIASPDEPPRVRARKIFDYLLENLEYDGRGCTYDRNVELGDLEKARELGCATCTEFHGLYAAYGRALGLPVRIVFGFSLPPDSDGGPIRGYHCWAEVYLPGVAWFPVDVSEAHKRESKEERDFYFGNLDANRVRFSSGRDIDLEPRQSGGPVDKFIFPIARFEGEDNEDIPLFPVFEFADVAP